jgi:hypothetical protein
MQIFKNYGWQEAGVVDIDLSEVKGKNRGYGIYRTHGMIRKPGTYYMSRMSLKRPLADLDKVLS